MNPESIWLDSGDVARARHENCTCSAAINTNSENALMCDVKFVPAEAYAELKERLATAEFSANGFESLYESECQEHGQLKGRVNKAMDIIGRFGGIDDYRRKTWVIDQAVRALTGDGYSEWVRLMKLGEDGPDTYEWDEGIAP